MNNNKKTIYKKDSKGKYRVLTYWTEGNTLYTESGLLDGKKKVDTRVCSAKNIGKSNETTPEEQAVLEMEAKIKNKLSKEYFESLEAVDNNIVIQPMLAKSYENEKDKITFPCLVEPKLDGIRAIVIIGQDGSISLRSRQNKPIDDDKTILPHIWEELSLLPEGIYDGELYAHNLSFQEITKLVKKDRGNDNVIIKYHVYDAIIEDMPNIFRVITLNDIFLSIEFKHLVKVMTETVDTYEGIEKHNKKCVSEGYEGSMIRNSQAYYEQGKRSSNLLKFKNFIDIDATLIDVEPQDSDPTMGVPKFTYTHETGDSQGLVVTFSANCKLSHEDRQDLLSNKEEYLGKKGQIRFFEWTDDKIPRFPVFVGFKD